MRNQQPSEVTEFRKDQPIDGEANGAGGSRHGEDQRGSAYAGGRTREHGGRSDLLIAQRSEQLSEACELFFEDSGERLIRSVTGRQPGSTGDQDRLARGVVTEREHVISNPLGLVRENLVVANSMPGRFQAFVNQRAAPIRLDGSGVADGYDGAHDRFNATSSVFGFSHHRVLSYFLPGVSGKPPQARHGPHSIHRFQHLRVSPNKLGQVRRGDPEILGRVTHPHFAGSDDVEDFTHRRKVAIVA